MAVQDRKDREFQRREQDILAAALQLFKGDNWQTVTIEEIAQAAEIGKGTVYSHFASKDEIYARLTIDFGASLLERLRALDYSQDVLAILTEIIGIFWTSHLSSPAHHQLFQHCDRPDFKQGVTADTRQHFESVDEEIMGLIGGVLQRGIDQGLFVRKPIERLVLPAQAAVMGGIQIYLSGCVDTIEPAQFLTEITQFILAGLMNQDALRRAAIA